MMATLKMAPVIPVRQNMRGEQIAPTHTPRARVGARVAAKCKVKRERETKERGRRTCGHGAGQKGDAIVPIREPVDENARADNALTMGAPEKVSTSENPTRHCARHAPAHLNGSIH
jgi:hypothetical protein